MLGVVVTGTRVVAGNVEWRRASCEKLFE